MNLKLWKRGCAALLTGIMVWTQPLCVLAETGGSVEAAESAEENASEEQQEMIETASTSDASGEESENESGSGILTQQVVFDDAVELINDLAVESVEEDELASDSDADEIELVNDLEYDLASDADADQVELTNDLVVEELDPEWMTEERSYTFEWGDLVDGIPEIDFSDYILDGEIDGNAGIATLSLDSDSDIGDYWSEQIDEDALDYYGLLVDYYDAVIGETGSVEETFGLGEIGTFEAVEDYEEEADNQLDGLIYYVYQAIYAFRYDYPMMFWEPTITCDISLSGYKDADGLYTGTITGRIKITCDLSDSEVYDMVDEITGVIGSFDLSGDTDYAVLKSVHDQICEIADYDDTLATDYAHSAYGALVLGVSVCEGYAKAFKVFCDELGIPCVLIVGQGGSGSSYGAHMWNYVQMDDGIWYGVDVTWDDQDSGILDACFLVGSNTLDTFADTFGNMHIEEPLTIVAGDSTVYLYYPAIAQERYVESEADTTEIVSIPDENLKAALLETGDTNGDGEMSVAEMESLSYVSARELEITDLTGLEYAVNLGDLEVSDNQLTDLSPLAGLVNLYHLELGNCGLTSDSIGALSSLTNVNDLYLAGNQIDDISALAGLTGLNVLYLNDNFAVSDLSPLSGMENLWDLWLQNNLVEDLSPLSGLTNLSTLYLNENQVSDLSPLSGLTNLSTLELGYNQIEDISLLASLGGQEGQLHVLNLDGNDIVDLSPIQNLVWLNQLTVNNNQLTVMPDLTALEGLDLYQDGEPREMFVGNRIIRDEFTGKFAENIEVTEAWLDLNSYDGTVVNDDTIVEIPDASLKSALLAAGDTDGDGEMTRTEMSYLTGFGDEWNGIADLTGLEYAVNLTSLGLNNNEITDISPLAGLTRLTGLELGWNQIEDISPLSGLTNLNSIMLDDNKITDISPLQELTNLTSLTLSINEIADISPLQELTDLYFLDISNNQITDISAIQNLTRLSTFYANNNELTTVPDLTALTELMLYDDGNPRWMFTDNRIPRDEFTGKFADNIEVTEEWLNVNSYDPESATIVEIPDEALKALIVENYDTNGDGEMSVSEMRQITSLTNRSHSGIKDLTGLEYATNLTDLNLYNYWPGNYAGISDLTPLSGLTSLTSLDLSNNDVTDISPLSSLVNLETLKFYDCPVDDISALKELTGLKYLFVTGGGISDISVLAGMDSLVSLSLYQNAISDISVLADKESLEALRLFENEINDISALSGLTNLQGLYLDDNAITDLSPIQNMVNLQDLYICNNQLTEMPYLTELTWLALYDEYDEDDEVWSEPRNMFSGNQIPEEEFAGKFADGIELTQEWLDLNSYVSSGETPVITVQPESAVGEIGDTITFAVEADKAVSYIWYYSADDGASWKLLKTWEGYDTDTLSFELTGNRLNYLYHCVLTGSDGSTVTTDDVYVRETGLTIVTQPVSVTASIGDTVTYTVEALKAVSYNWYYSADDGDSWSILKSWDGYDTAELSFEVTSNRLNYLYHCVVKGSDGTALITDDVYVEEQGFAIVMQPESVTASIGDTVTFATEAAKAVSYNWYYSADSGDSWKLLKSWEGYNTDTLCFEVTNNRLGYLYHCVIKGSDGTTLTTDDVYVEEQGFAIVTQPENVAASIGDTVTFVTEAAKAVSYNWYYSADCGESWKLLKSWDGYDTNTLSFEVTSNRLNYLYHCVVKGSDGTTLTTDAVSIEAK